VQVDLLKKERESEREKKKKEREKRIGGTRSDRSSIS